MKNIEQLMIEMVDVENLKNTFCGLGNYNPSYINVEQYLSTWASNKKHIFALMGNKLKVEKEVALDLTGNDKIIQSKLNSFKEYIGSFGYKYIRLFSYLGSITNMEFVNNVVNSDIKILGVQLRKGDRISRSIPKLLKEISKEESSKVVTKYSMVLQEFKAKGKVVVSIDPLDYITMSENNSNWHSCHALAGCYRTGTLSYMVDPTTAISYAKPSENVISNYTDRNGIVHEFEYVNKIWRQIVLFSSKLTYATQARQYPASMLANQTSVASILNDLLSDRNEVEYKTVSWCPDSHNVSYDCHDTYEGSDYCYNDISNEAFGTAYTVLPSSVEDKENFFKEKINIGDVCRVGGEVKCICGCGNYAYDNESFFCDECN